MFDLCLRCGRPIKDGAPRAPITLHGEAGWQHTPCGEYYRGTQVHHLREPETNTRQEVY